MVHSCMSFGIGIYDIRESAKNRRLVIEKMNTNQKKKQEKNQMKDMIAPKKLDIQMESALKFEKLLRNSEFHFCTRLCSKSKGALTTNVHNKRKHI